MFDPPQLLQQIQSNIAAAKEAVLSEHAQPEYHFSMLLAHIRALPEDWNSETKKLLHVNVEPSLEDLLQAISMDIESSSGGSGSAVSSGSSSNRSASNNPPDDPSSRLWTFQALLRFAIVIYALRSGHRSTGP